MLLQPNQLLARPYFKHPSLKVFTRKEQLDLEKSIALLKAADIHLKNSEQSLKAIAASNGVSPQHLYEIIKSAKATQASKDTEKAAESSESTELPETPLPGFGRKTLFQACTELGLDPTTVIKELKTIGISVTSEITIKELAGNYNKTPQELYAVILGITDAK